MKNNTLTTEHTLALACAADTHTGLVRDTNEDLYYFDAARGILFVIDGVGGHRAGERAAALALHTILECLENSSGNVEATIREAVTSANNRIFDEAQAHRHLIGMACVLTLAIVSDGAITIGHVGDTRLYEIHGGRIEKLTRDHSPVGEREDACTLTEIEAMRHPRRNEVYRDVGSEPHSLTDEFIEIIRRPFDARSALLLCSDGLSDMLTSAQILRIAERYDGDPAAIVRQLVAAANDAGGRDNITVVYAAGVNSVAKDVLVSLKTVAFADDDDAEVAEITKPLSAFNVGKPKRTRRSGC